MANPAGEPNDGVLKLDFDRRLTVQFRGSVVTSNSRLSVPKIRFCNSDDEVRRGQA
jgi:hypothetical protein